MSTKIKVPEEINGLTIIKNAYPLKTTPKKRVRNARSIYPVERHSIKYYVGLWGVSYPTLWRWTQRKFMNPPLPSVKIGSKILIPIEDGERWMLEYGKRDD